MKKIVLFGAVLIVALAMFLAVGYEMKVARYDFKGQSVDKNVSMQDFDGFFKVVYFGYMFCPDVCPTTLAMVSNALDELGANNVKILFFSVDLERDDIKSCDEFAKYFYKNALCIRINDENKLKKMVKNYGAKYEINKNATEYSVAHSPFIYLLDEKGRFIKEITNLTYENIKSELANIIKAYKISK